MDLEAVLTAVRGWPLEERLKLIAEVWDGLDDDPQTAELTGELRDLLDRRLADLETAPDDVLRWEEIEAYVRRAR